MQRETKTRVGIAALIYSMTNAVIFGAGLITVLLLPDLRGQDMISIPVVVVASLILAAPIAWLIAPRLRARYWRQRMKQHAQVMELRHV
jgi:multidrug efflux pump subunit AcrB